MEQIDENEHLPVEIFGFIPEDSERAMGYRESKICPFTGNKCTKEEYRKNKPPVGSCSASHKGADHIVCPNRFLQGNKELLKKATNLILDWDSNTLLIHEVTIGNLGRVDWIAAKLDSSRKLVNYVPIEILANQTTSTGELTNAIREYEETGSFSKNYYGYGMNTCMYLARETFGIGLPRISQKI